jgi:hypothetical protein
MIVESNYFHECHFVARTERQELFFFYDMVTLASHIELFIDLRFISKKRYDR